MADMLQHAARCHRCVSDELFCRFNMPSQSTRLEVHARKRRRLWVRWGGLRGNSKSSDGVERRVRLGTVVTIASPHSCVRLVSMVLRTRRAAQLCLNLSLANVISHMISNADWRCLEVSEKHCARKLRDDREGARPLRGAAVLSGANAGILRQNYIHVKHERLNL